jgi:chemotaxis protein CheD
VTAVEGLPTARYFLSPGEVVCAAEPLLVTTVLGSCVSITLWDKITGVGGINHFVLPRGEDNARYGVAAVQHLFDGVVELGGHLRSLEAKVFGGAAVLPAGGQGSVGTQNVSFALGELSRRGIPVVGRRTGGERGRLLMFNTETGDAFVRWLAEQEPLSSAS